MDSILTSIKKLLGLEDDYTCFDSDIIIHINSTLMTLRQIGVGPDKPAYISGKADTWSSVFGNTSDIEAVKTYIYLKVRMVFDPPSSSFVLEAMKQQASEIEWRLNVQAENKEEV